MEEPFQPVGSTPGRWRISPVLGLEADPVPKASVDPQADFQLSKPLFGRYCACTAKAARANNVVNNFLIYTLSLYLNK